MPDLFAITPPGVAGGQTLYEAIVDAAGGGDYVLLSTALTAGARTIFIRNGTYIETADIDLPANDITIVGENKEKTIIDFDSNRQLDFNLKKDCVIRNLTIVGGNGNGAVFMRGSSNMVVDCLFESNGIHIKIQTASNNLISRCEFKGFVGVDIRSDSNRNRIVDCFFNESSFGINDGDFNEMIGCTYSSSTDVFIITKGNLIIGNIFGNDAVGKRGGVVLVGDRNIVTGNVFLRGQAGINAIAITGNNNIVSNNNIEGATVAYDDNISLSSTANNNIISNNYIAGAAAYGIHIEASTETGNLILGNQFNSNTTADINDLGSGTTIQNNYPLTPVTGEKRFIQMKNTSGAGLVQGDLVTYKAVAAGDEATTTTVQGDDLVYAMADETIADTVVGRFQILGKTTALKVDGTVDITIGDFIGTFTTAKIGMKASEGDTAIAIALEAYTVNDSAGVIDALLIKPKVISRVAAYGEINRVSNATETAIATQNVYVQVTIFDTNGESNLATPDHTEDHITVVKAGVYKISCSVTLNSVGGAGSTAEMEIQKNNGNVRVGALHVDRTLSGGGAEASAETITGLASLAVNDTIEVWIKNETNTQNYIVEDITLSLIRIGET